VYGVAGMIESCAYWHTGQQSEQLEPIQRRAC